MESGAADGAGTGWAELMCGVVGIHCTRARTRLRSPRWALFALQHRGQESAGVAVSDGRGVMVYKDLGLVDQVLDERRLQSLRGELAIAHCRYSTTGSTIWENSQPTLRMGRSERSRSVTTATWSTRAQLLDELPGGTLAPCGHDRHGAAHRAPRQRAGARTLSRRCCSLLPRVSGAYSLVVMDENARHRRARSVRFPAAGPGLTAHGRRRGVVPRL